MANAEGYRGQQNPFDKSGDLNQLLFIARGVLAQSNFATLVQVQACTNNGEISDAGFVDVLPLVAQVTGDGEAIPHTTIYSLPFFRLQAGSFAVIIDPKPGDIGIAIFADRDISAIKENRAASNPGSSRQNSMSDGLYVGGFLNGEATQFIRVADDGIEISSPVKITLTAPTVEINASAALNITSALTSISGAVSQLGGLFTIAIDAIIDNIPFLSHKHKDTKPGSPAEKSGTPTT